MMYALLIDGSDDRVLLAKHRAPNRNATTLQTPLPLDLLIVHSASSSVYRSSNRGFDRSKSWVLTTTGKGGVIYLEHGSVPAFSRCKLCATVITERRKDRSYALDYDI